MPLYEYECDACAHRFEVIQKYSDPHIEACPKCRGAVKKLLSSPAIQFKGTGWYITDYARAGKSDSKKDSGSSSSEKGGDSGSTAAKSDTKAESKAESKSESTSESKSESKSKSDSKPSTE